MTRVSAEESQKRMLMRESIIVHNFESQLKPKIFWSRAEAAEQSCVI